METIFSVQTDGETHLHVRNPKYAKQTCTSLNRGILPSYNDTPRIQDKVKPTKLSAVYLMC